jgi:hypothetical protein
MYQIGFYENENRSQYFPIYLLFSSYAGDEKKKYHFKDFVVSTRYIIMSSNDQQLICYYEEKNRRRNPFSNRINVDTKKNELFCLKLDHTHVFFFG